MRDTWILFCHSMLVSSLSLSLSLVGGTIVLGGANIYVFFAFGHIFILPFSFRDPVRTIRSVSVRSFVVCIRIFMLKEFDRCWSQIIGRSKQINACMDVVIVGWECLNELLSGIHIYCLSTVDDGVTKSTSASSLWWPWQDNNHS